MEQLENTKALVLSIVRSIVEFPDEVEINASEVSDFRGEYIQVNIKTAISDIPQTIGKRGAHADAIRIIATLSAIRSGYRKPLYFRVDAPIMPQNHFYKK